MEMNRIIPFIIWDLLLKSHFIEYNLDLSVINLYREKVELAAEEQGSRTEVLEFALSSCGEFKLLDFAFITYVHGICDPLLKETPQIIKCFYKIFATFTVESRDGEIVKRDWKNLYRHLRFFAKNRL